MKGEGWCHSNDGYRYVPNRWNWLLVGKLVGTTFDFFPSFLVSCSFFPLHYLIQFCYSNFWIAVLIFLLSLVHTHTHTHTHSYLYLYIHKYKIYFFIFSSLINYNLITKESECVGMHWRKFIKTNRRRPVYFTRQENVSGNLIRFYH